MMAERLWQVELIGRNETTIIGLGRTSRSSLESEEMYGDLWLGKGGESEHCRSKMTS